MKLRIIILSALTIMMLMPSLVSAQKRARVAGLEGDKVYMELLSQEETLQKHEDSLNRRVVQVREKFSSDPDNRSVYSAEILKIEGELFDVRTKLGMIAVKITTIEQDFVINSLNSGQMPVMQSVVEANDIDSVGNDKSLITLNGYFQRHLNANDFATLQQAQSREAGVKNFYEQYAENNAKIVAIESQYRTEQNPIVADSLYSKYETLSSINSAVADSLDAHWSYVFDNKSYIYSYLFDKLNKKELLDDYAKKLQATNQQVGENSGKFASDIIVQYVYGKRLLIDYELMVADALKLHKATDSLSRAAADLLKVEPKLAKADIAEREFIKYDSVDVVLPITYNAKHPIPTLEIPPRGVVYRVLVGSYTIQQHPSVFKGTQPLAVHKEGGRYNYYAGGFRTLEEAAQAVEYLKTKWIKNGRVVMWKNGERHLVNSDLLSDEDGSLYRVEITSESDLNDQILSTIKENAPDKEMSRLDNKYVIGTFPSKLIAQSLVDAIRKIEPELEINLITIEN